jgi:hypothetical protein
MEKMNITSVRYEGKCRETREQKGLHMDLYNYIKSMGDDYGEILIKCKEAKLNEKNRNGKLNNLHALSRKLQTLKKTDSGKWVE